MRKTTRAVDNTIAAVLVVAALMIGLLVGMAIGYTISNSKSTTTLTQEGEELQCVVTHYEVFFLNNNASSGKIDETSTSTSPVQTYQTSTSGSQSVGYATTWTIVPTTTETGFRNWNITVCTVISG